MAIRLFLVIDSLTPSGAEQSMAALAPRYRELGVDLTVAALHDRSPNLVAEFEQAGATVRLVDRARLGLRGTVKGLTTEIRACAPDLVHTVLFESDICGRIAARLARRPVVSSIVNESYGREHRADPAVSTAKLGAVQAADAVTGRLTRRMHALTAHSADVMAARLVYPRDRIDVVGRGRDPEALGRRSGERRARVRASLGIDDRTPVIVAAARQEFQKGLDVLVRALGRLRTGARDPILLVAGREGSQTPALRALTEDLGLTDAVTFLGPRGDVPDLLCAGDVFVVPSRREGFGSVLVEAMALEIPIVASNIPPISEVLAGTGVLARPDDADALSDAIVAVLDHASATRRRVHAARQRFENQFTTDVIGSEMLTFYRRALDGGGP
jgi:glycosyltransferase involved in cell wall biosynthesis